jgi:hypothetical protein
MTAQLSGDTMTVLYAVAFFVMLASAVFELVQARKVTWALLVSASWACVMFVWWNP